MIESGHFWIVDDVIAYVDSGVVTIQIGKPNRALPRDRAYNVADKIWYAGQMRELEIARQRGETKVVPLTDRRRRSSLRLGGGFMITQGTKLLVARRSLTAHRRPGQLCEFGGIFEVDEPDKDHISNDFIASLLKESIEIAIKRHNRLYIPQLSALSKNLNPDKPELSIYFQPPDVSLNNYNDVIREELLTEVKHALIPGCDKPEQMCFYMKILDYERSVKLQFGYSPEISVEITAEVDTSSLECVGVLSFPENIDLAAATYLQDQSKAPNAELTEDKKQLLEQLKQESIGESEIQIWDTECIRASRDAIRREVETKTHTGQISSFDEYERVGDKQDMYYFPLDREIHSIDFSDRSDHVSALDLENVLWDKPKSRDRKSEKSRLGQELSKIRLRATGGNFATEN